MIILPEIPIILEFDNKLIKTPAMWSLALALNCTLGYYTKKHNKKMLRAIYDDQSAIMPKNDAALLLQVSTEQETIIITGKAVKEGAKITIMTQVSFDVYYFVVLQSNLLQSLPVVTDESLHHDLKLLKKLINPSTETQKLFHNKVLKIGGSMDDTY